MVQESSIMKPPTSFSIARSPQKTMLSGMEVATSRPDYLPALSAAKTSKLSLLDRHHILAIDEASKQQQQHAREEVLIPRIQIKSQDKQFIE